MRHYLKFGRFLATQRIIRHVQGRTDRYYTVCPNKFILKWLKILANNLDIHVIWTHCISMITFECTYVDKLKCNTYALNRVCVCYVSSTYFNIRWDFGKRRYFYKKGTCIGFFKSRPSARLYLEVLVTLPRLNLKTVSTDSLLCYIYFCFLFSYLCSVFLS